MPLNTVSADLEIALLTGQLVGASPEALRRLGRDPAGVRLPLTLDSAMPALSSLRRAEAERRSRPEALAGEDEVQQRQTVEPLVFWSPAGAVTLACATLAEPTLEAGVVALRLIETEAPVAAHPPETRPSLASPDAPAVDANGDVEGVFGPDISSDLGPLAHELRTPLAAIQSLADAMLGGHLGDVESRRNVAYLASIRDTARHALAVVDAMVGRSVMDGRSVMLGRPLGSESRCHGTPTGVNIALAAREVADGLAALAARAGVSLRVACPDGLAVLGNATDVRQMLINLVSNAVAHGGDGAEVAVTAAAEEEAEGTGFVAIAVTDTGRGIPRHVIDRLEAGLSVVAERGSGDADRVRLGLSLTKALAENNGGRLDIRSRPGQTVARLLLPACR